MKEKKQGLASKNYIEQIVFLILLKQEMSLAARTTPGMQPKKSGSTSLGALTRPVDPANRYKLNNQLILFYSLLLHC